MKKIILKALTLAMLGFWMTNLALAQDDGFSEGWSESINTVPAENSSFRELVVHSGSVWVDENQGGFQIVESSRLLQPGYRLKTGKASIGYISFSEGHKVWLQPDTEVLLMSNSKVSLSNGEVRVLQKKDGLNKLVVKTPIGAVAETKSVEYNIIHRYGTSHFEALSTGITVKADVVETLSRNPKMSKVRKPIQVQRGYILSVNNTGNYILNRYSNR